LAIAGLWLHREVKPILSYVVEVEQRELKLVKILFASVLGLGFFFSFIEASMLFTLITVSFLMWTPLGFLLMVVALLKGVRGRISEVRNKN